MTSQTYSDAWVCVDCYFAHHYGATEIEGKWFAGPDFNTCDHEACDREPLGLLADCEVTDNTYPNGDDPEDPDETGERSFSWRSCDGCGSNLGGSRHRLAVWEKVSA